MAASGSLMPFARGSAAEKEGGTVRVGAVFRAQVRKSWPYPGFDAAGRQREILAALRAGCPGIEFVPVTVETPDETQKATWLKDEVDGYLVYVTTLSWSLRGAILALGQLGKPMVVADEFLGGCGAFLTGYADLRGRGF